MGTWTPGPGVVELPDGRRVRGTALRRERGDVPPPDLAVVLVGPRPDALPWPHRWVCWPDFGLPASTHDAVAALAEAHRRAAEVRVEVACDGGVGRTGTALALLAVMGGVPVEEAVGWVRARYHPRAVETPWQRWWHRRVARRLDPRGQD